MKPETVVQASPHQVSCEREGQATLLHLNTGAYYALDPVGAAVWRLIEEPRSVAFLRDAIVAQYDVDPASCERDLFELLDGLAKEGLIEIRPLYSPNSC